MNTLVTSIEDESAAQLDKAAHAETQFEATTDTDYRNAMLKSQTKAKYLTRVSAMSKDAVKYCAKQFDVDTVREVSKNSYSLSKLIDLCEMCASKSKAVIQENVMKSITAHLVTCETESRYSAFVSAVAHKTDTQASQTIVMLKRLDVIASYSKRDNTVTLNEQSSVLADINSCYE